MRNGLVGLSVILVVLTGCGDSDVGRIEAAVKARLVDPDSVKFGSVTFSPKGESACIEYNAKNRMGGYSGQTIASLIYGADGWKVEQMEWRADLCPRGGKFIAR